MEENSLKDIIAVKYIAHYRSEFKNSLFLGPERQEKQTQSKDNKLIFPGANSIVMNNLSGNYENERAQSFLHTLPGSRGINCIAQSPNKKYIAWSEETEKLPVIILVDITTGKRKMFATEIKNRKYIALAFNGTQGSDPKVLVALTNGPDYSLVQWNFQKNKFVCNVIDKVDKPESTKPQATGSAASEKYNELFFFKEQDFVVVIGKGTIKTYKLINDKVQLKDSPFARKEINEKDYNFISHCVLKDGLLVGTDNGDIFYFTINCEFKLILQSSPGEGLPIETMLVLPASKSFLVGSSEGQLFLYEKGDIKSMYVRSQRHLSLKDYKGRITSLLATPKEDEIFIGLQPGVILRASMEKADSLHYDHALQSFHTESITGLDVCLRKPLVATCSHDKTVRVWNHAERNNLEICKDFEEKALSLAFHPSGLHLAVSFPDKIKLINIIDSDLVPYKELSQKNCYEVKFSNGGHLFAVVNSLMVQIYNFYTCEQPPNYQFKALGGRFQCIVWEEDDLGIFLGTSDGTVLYNKLEDPSVRLTVLSVPGFSVRSILSVFSSKDEKQGTVNERVVYAAGSFGPNFEVENRCIYEIKITPKSEKDKERSELTKDESRYIISAPHKIFTSCNISRIGMLNSKKIFFYCVDEKGAPGCIRYCRYPLLGVKQIAEIQSHAGTVGKMAVCYDDNDIFTAGEDGSFIVYEIKDKDCKIKTQILDPAEQFLFSKKKLIERKIQLETLRSKNAKAKEEREEAATRSKQQNNKQISEWDQRIKERSESQKRRMDQQMEEILRIEQEQQRRLTTLELEHKNKRESVERDYAEKILLEQTRKAQLAKTKELEARTFNEIIQLNRDKHQQEVQRRTSELKDQLKRETAGKELLEMKLGQLKSKNDQEQVTAESAAERDIKQKKQHHQENIKKLQQEYSAAESLKLSKRNDHDSEQKTLLEKKQHLKKSLEEIQKINQTHEQLLQEKQSHAKEIEQRQKTIKDKGTRIQQLKKKTQELEKFKFVLDYKIKELKREIGPRQEEIAKMKEQISNMNAEITHFKRMNANMSLIVKDLVSKKKGMQNELEQQNRVETSNEQYIKSFEYDISQMYQNTIGDFKKLKAKMLEIFRKYVQDDDDKKKKIESNIDQQKQFIKQRAHLQSTVKGLKDKFRNSMKLHEADHKRIMGQNEDLISQINDLKRQKKNMLDEIKRREQQKKMVENLQQHKIDLNKQSQQLNARLKSLKVQYEQLLKQNRNRQPRRSEDRRQQEAI